MDRQPAIAGALAMVLRRAVAQLRHQVGSTLVVGPELPEGLLANTTPQRTALATRIPRDAAARTPKGRASEGPPAAASQRRTRGAVMKEQAKRREQPKA